MDFSHFWVERQARDASSAKVNLEENGTFKSTAALDCFHFPSQSDVYIYGSIGDELRLCGSVDVGTSAGCLPRCDAVTPHRREFTARRAFPAESRDDGKRKQRRGANVLQINRTAPPGREAASGQA